jgi:hypothetical protein
MTDATVKLNIVGESVWFPMFVGVKLLISPGFSRTFTYYRLLIMADERKKEISRQVIFMSSTFYVMYSSHSHSEC